MPIVGGLDIHRKQITFDYLDTVTGEVKRGQIAPADRAHLRAWLARFAGCEDAAFAVEGCAGGRYVTQELAAAGVAAHLAEPADTAAARGRKQHAKTDARHLRTLLAEGRLPECWIPPAQILGYRALLETYQDLRRAHTAWVQRIHAVFFHQGAPPPTSRGYDSTAACSSRRWCGAGTSARPRRPGPVWTRPGWSG
jgi:transposase